MTRRHKILLLTALYVAQGLPYVAVMTLAVVLYKNLGVSNTEIALYTSWLYLPWVIKPLWSPVVDLLKTRRAWIVAMQLLIGAALAGVALTLPGDSTTEACREAFLLAWRLGSLCLHRCHTLQSPARRRRRLL